MKKNDLNTLIRSRTAWCVGLIVLAAVGLRLLRSGGPGRSSAAALREVPPTLATATVEHAPRANPFFKRLREWSAASDSPVTRNLFYINLDSFPRDGTQRVTTPTAVAAESFWDRLAKSMTSQAEEQDKRQHLVESVKEQAAQLHLQRVLMGPTPTALVDGQLVGEGDVVANYRVLRIQPRGITIEREGVKLEILFK